jgi:hypothetical protein
MVWVFWGGVATFLGGIGALSCWFDRDARRRGATPLSGGAMQRARWARNIDTEQRLNSVMIKGMTPRAHDAARDAWDGKADH